MTLGREFDIIKGIVTTEKTSRALAENKYTFIVDVNSTRDEIKSSIEKVFEVEVLDVNIINSDGKVKKEKANIYDVIVLPSLENKSFIEIELRRFYEYARLALNFEELSIILKQKMSQYGLSDEDIKFNNDFVYGGDLDD